MNSIFLSKTWGEFLKEVTRNPQSYVFWLIIFLVVLFLISRLRNRMEERGVNRAIYISRGLVGTFIAFIVTPIIFYIMLNLMALVHQVKTIDVGFLANWIGLTLTSYWWLLKCFFGSASLSGGSELYSVDAIIRILWVLLPFSFIWLRMSKTRVGMLFLIPLIIGVLVITRYKLAPATFITQDKEIVNRIPGLNWFVPDPDAPKTATGTDSTDTAMLKPIQRQIIAGALAFMVLAGFVIGLYFEYRVIGLFISLVGLLGFLLMAPHELDPSTKKNHPKEYHVNTKNLIARMDSLYLVDGESIEVYELSLQIGAAYNAQIAVDMIRFPDSLCTKYESYFYDWCKEN